MRRESRAHTVKLLFFAREITRLVFSEPALVRAEICKPPLQELMYRPPTQAAGRKEQGMRKFFTPDPIAA
jgi:hypothetical protein